MALGSLITSTLTHPPCTSHTAFASACKRSSAARSAVTLDPPDPHAAQLAPPFRSAAYKSFCRCDAPDGWSACMHAQKICARLSSSGRPRSVSTLNLSRTLRNRTNTREGARENLMA
eukprot:CAMPEP_0181220778 /NCGR_PEP_ID=MMETSP1096-20121128/29021_1 /TAXON_ID=156174 ORGANISM="Chrysochromulina ericina, Strain CCMP281" /NCGR_SAMPLE_ID=MMETSP1096 /ASSEMBLY_ACC=CAM_ASM_000453 /LENGTH=116 /DNA_ID=CAMNT_0023313309 /DNA_START=217 /DNA_END=570 /DNA_ORIENTATION=-